MTVYFDMDGTIADFYGVPNWLELIENFSTAPYERALPLIDITELNDIFHILHQNNIKIGIISWTSKSGMIHFNKKVRQAKLQWLKKYFSIRFDEIHIIKYGYRKDYVAFDKNGMLFDDDDMVREHWRGRAINPKTDNIIEVLKALL